MSKDGEEKTEDDKMDGVWRCVAACLLLGELEFDDKKFNKDRNAFIEIKNKDILQKVG